MQLLLILHKVLCWSSAFRPLMPKVVSCINLYLPSSISLRKTVFQGKWSSAFPGNLSWSNFCNYCDEFAIQYRTLALEIAIERSSTFLRPQTLPRRDRLADSRPIFRHWPLLSNPAEAQHIQTLYRHSKNRAARRILFPNNSSAPEPLKLQNSSKYTFSHRNCDILSLQN